jgi:hypothetical protein
LRHSDRLLPDDKFSHVRSKIFSRARQNFHQDAAKFPSGRSKIFIKTRQNFLQDAAKFPSGLSFGVASSLRRS